MIYKEIHVLSTEEWFYPLMRDRGAFLVIDERGNRLWIVDGCCHRLDGPALECYDGSVSYYLRGYYKTLEQWEIERQQYLVQEIKDQVI
jgi:hypothetical protein